MILFVIHFMILFGTPGTTSLKRFIYSVPAPDTPTGFHDTLEHASGRTIRTMPHSCRPLHRTPEAHWDNW